MSLLALHTLPASAIIVPAVNPGHDWPCKSGTLHAEALILPFVMQKHFWGCGTVRLLIIYLQQLSDVTCHHA